MPSSIKKEEGKKKEREGGRRREREGEERGWKRKQVSLTWHSEALLASFVFSLTI